MARRRTVISGQNSVDNGSCELLVDRVRALWYVLIPDLCVANRVEGVRPSETATDDELDDPTRGQSTGCHER